MLLSKYIEHRRQSRLGRHLRSVSGPFDNSWQHQQRRRRQVRQQQQSDNEGVDHNDIFTNSLRRPPARKRLRVLELGCGTGLAGLAAAFSLSTGVTPTKDENKEASPSSDSQADSPPDSSPDCRSDYCGVDLVLTDLEYALENARANVERNSSSLTACGASVVTAKLDWTEPLPSDLLGKLASSFSNFVQEVVAVVVSRRVAPVSERSHPPINEVCIDTCCLFVSSFFFFPAASMFLSRLEKEDPS